MMPRLAKKVVKYCHDNAHNSSKYTDSNFTESSVKIFPLKDNEMFANKKLFIHYGAAKQDINLEYVLRRLNAIILDHFDDSANLVITDVCKKQNTTYTSEYCNNNPKKISTLMGLRSRKLVGLVQQNVVGNAVNNESLDMDGSRNLLDHVAKKGIRVLQIKDVWKWLREHHSMILQDVVIDDFKDEENETNYKSNDVKKLLEPSLKINDTTNQTRPTFHQKCIFQKDLWEETMSMPSDCKIEPVLETLESKQGDTLKIVSKKSTKIKKTATKSDGGYCECCNLNYTNLISHLTSAVHLEYASNEQNYEGIDQVIQDLSDIKSFLAIRIKKQNILDRRQKNRKLIKSLSANDFKSEIVLLDPKIESLSPKPDFIEPLLLHANNLDICYECEEVLPITDIANNYIDCCHYEDTSELKIFEINIQRHIFYDLLEEVFLKEEVTRDLDDIEEYVVAIESRQDDVCNIVTVDQREYHCKAQELAVTFAMDLFESELEIEDMEEYGWLEVVEENLVKIVDVVRDTHHCKVQELVTAENKVHDIECEEVYAADIASVQEKQIGNGRINYVLSNCISQHFLDLFIECEEFEIHSDSIDFEQENHNEEFFDPIAVSTVEPQLESVTMSLALVHDSEEDSDSSDSESIPRSIAFCCSFTDINLVSLSADVSPLHVPHINAFSPFFLNNLNNSPYYSLLSPNRDYRHDEYAPFGDSPDQQHSPIQDSFIDHQDSITDHQDSIIDHQDFITDHQDSIIDLRQTVNNTHNDLYFNTLSEPSLSRPSRSLNLDQTITNHFKNHFHIDVNTKSLAKAFLCEVTNISDINTIVDNEHDQTMFSFALKGNDQTVLSQKERSIRP